MALKFAVNGEQFVLPPDSVDPSVTLNEFIRRNTRFTGTKLSCGEGGCGACAVDLAKIDPATGKQIHVSVNSCLRPLASMDGWAVTTTEGLGGPQTGYHPIQERIADFNGLQCGFCTPGMVMTTYSALKNADGDISMKDLEKRFDGNICRCTGYRPILDFCKSFANDSDIEDLVSKKAKCCRHDCSSDPKFPEFLANHEPAPLRFEANGRVWIRPVNLAGLFDALDAPNSRVVIANTSTGIYKNDTAAVLVDAQAIPELLETSIGDDITIGGAVTVANFIALLQQAKEQLAGSFKANFLDNLITHAERVGNVHVRNVGSVAGNLILAKTKGFLSDLATILLGVQARVTVANRNGSRTVSLDEFLEGAELPRGEIVRAIHVPLATENAQFNSFKAALRPVNSHAYVNAAFQLILDGQTIQQAIIAFGGVLAYDVPGSRPILAKQTQAFLQGKPLNQETFKAALEVLKSEVQIQDSHKKAYRESLVAGFFYKFFVSLIGGDARVKSVTEDFFKTRPVSSGKQSFAYSAEHEPVSAPVSKLSAKALASGDAKFVDDIRTSRDTAFGAFITHTRARAKVLAIDVSRALQAPGVIGVVLAEDIPGPNTYSPMGETTSIFENNFAEFFGQPAGLILADTLRHAEAAAKLVQISYESEILLPVITVEQAQLFPEFDTGVINAFEQGDYQAAIDNAPKKASGTVFLGSQQHFYMEPQTADATLDEDGTMVLRIASQWPAGTNGAVAACLKLPLNKVRVVCRRAGGGFGGKLSHHLIGGCAASIAALKFKQPVRIALNRNVDMALAGGREETTLNYTVGFNEEGKILGIILDGHLNSGAYRDLSWFCNMAFTTAISQTYELPAYKISTHLWKTNLPPRTAVRAPSEISGSYCIETVLERIAFELGLSPELVRERNFYVISDPSVQPALPNGSLLHDFTVPKMWEQVKQKFDAASLEAQVRQFNLANRWKKQGFAITPVRYETTMFGRSATVSIFTDGSVIVHHGSSDIGQGLHVKVIQVVAHELGKLLGAPLSLNLVRSGDNDTYIVPNATFTGGSTSSETAAEAARLASAELVLKLKPVLADLEAGAKERNEPFTPDWADLCNQAVNRFGLHLSAVGTFNPGMSYQNYGVCLSTVELDVITGDVEVLRSHIIYDCGKSLNPAIDVGQAEGAYVMGLGFLLREVVDISAAGELLSNGTWEYKPPCFRDIPRVFSVDLLQDATFDRGVLSSKASGEPPLVLANSVAFAVRHAIQEARREAGQEGFFDLPVPFTPDIIQQLCGVSPSQFQ